MNLVIINVYMVIPGTQIKPFFFLFSLPTLEDMIYYVADFFFFLPS